MTALSFTRTPSPEQLEQLQQNLSGYNRQFMPKDSQPFALAATGAEGALVGAAKGESYWGRLYVDLFWITGELRGQGLGRQLMAQVEAIGRERGCCGVDLWTMSFQAPGFYEKMGFRQVGEISGYLHGHTKRFYSKDYK